MKPVITTINGLLLRLTFLLVIATSVPFNIACKAQGIGAFNPQKFREQHDASYRKSNAERAKNIVVFQSNGKYGVKNATTNEVIVKAKYDKISDFISGYAEFRKGDKKGILDKYGNEYLKAKYQEIIFPPASMLESVSAPYFIVSEKGDGKYRLVSETNTKGDQFTQISISPTLECFGEVSEGIWTPIEFSTGKSDGTTLSATRKEMTTRRLSDDAFLFNNNIYMWEATFRGPNYLGRNKIINITEGKSKKKEIELNGSPYLYDGTSIIDLTSFPDYKTYSRKTYPSEADKEAIGSPDGIYIETKKDYYSTVVPYLVKGNRLYQMVLAKEYDKSNRSRMFDEIKEQWKGLIALTDTRDKTMGLYAGDKIILPATFGKVSFGRHKKGNDIFIVCLALDDTRPESAEYYDRAYETFREATGGQTALYVRTPELSRLYGWSDSPINVERSDEFIIENNIIWSCNDKGKTAYGSNGQELISGISEYSPFSGGLYKIISGGKEGLIKFSEGKIITILPPQYNRIRQDNELISGWTKNGPSPNILIEKDGKQGLYADDGSEILPCNYDKIEKLWQLIQQQKTLIMKVTENSKTGLIGIDGKVIIPCKYANITSSYNDRDDSTLIYATDLQGQKTMFDANGKPLNSSGEYDSFGTGGRVYKNGKMGFIDEDTKKLIIPCKYDRDALQGGMYGPSKGKNTRIALGYENDNGTATVDIWTFTGKKLASKTFPSNARYSMTSFIEQWLGIKVGW